MKTIRLKFLLPIAVFMVAIAAAFATQTDGKDDFALVQGYIFENGVCTPHGSCSNNEAAVCTDNVGRQVFGLGPTGCKIRLTMNWQP